VKSWWIRPVVSGSQHDANDTECDVRPDRDLRPPSERSTARVMEGSGRPTFPGVQRHVLAERRSDRAVGERDRVVTSIHAGLAIQLGWSSNVRTSSMATALATVQRQEDLRSRSPGGNETFEGIADEATGLVSDRSDGLGSHDGRHQTGIHRLHHHGVPDLTHDHVAGQ
jgi:hypothetical protein